MNPNPYCSGSVRAEESDSLAAHQLLLLTQTEIQKLLNKKGLNYRDLARRLGVTEARVSQIFSESAGSLTVRTIAKIFNRLGEEAIIVSCSELKRMTTSTTIYEDIAGDWDLAGLGEFYVVIHSNPTFPDQQLERQSEGGPKLSSLTKVWAHADRTSKERAA